LLFRDWVPVFDCISKNMLDKLGVILETTNERYYHNQCSH